MIESEVDQYKLDYNDKQQTLRISIINNQQISIILTDQISNKKYKAIITLSQLKQSCDLFLSANTINEAIKIIKSPIESGQIFIIEDPNNNIIELKYNISSSSGNIEFVINLVLEEKIDNNNDIKVLPPTFDYQGNKEVEENYENITNDTTEYTKPIIKPNITPPLVEIEYIEPILQVHYPDGSTESTNLPPRVQDVSGNLPNVTDKQFKSIKKYFSSINPNITLHRSNSAVTNKIIPSNTTKGQSLENNNNDGEKKYNNFVRSANEKTNIVMNSERPISNFNNTEIFNNNSDNKIFRNYSCMTIPHKTVEINNRKSNTRIPHSPYLKNNNNNKIIERRPRMINLNSIIIGSPKNNPRAISLPHQDFNNFSQRKELKNIHQGNYSNKTFQIGNFYGSNNKKYPYDRNTHNIRRHNANLILSISPKEKTPYQNQAQNNIAKNNRLSIESQQLQIQDRLTLIHIQQQKVQKVQQQLAQIQQRQKEFQQKKLNYKNQNLSQSPLVNRQLENPILLREQIHISPNPNSIKQSQTYTYQLKQEQEFGHKSSQEIKSVETEAHNFSQTQYKSQISTPIPSTTSLYNKFNRTITPEQITLAQMASIKNGQNPNCSSLEAITLPTQENDEIQEKEEKQTEEQLPREEQYNENENIEQNEEVEENEDIQQNEILDIEALFITEEGRVIFRNGLLRGIIHKYAEIDDVVSKIQDLLLEGVKFYLVYKAFDVGDKAQTFHEKCDKLDMSLVLIETDKDIRFGGFTTQSWEGNCQIKNDNNAFVFSLETNKIFDIIPDEPAVGCYPKFGPVFFGCQIRIYNNFFTTGGTTCLKGLNYNTDKDYELNNGNQNYLIKDIEVYGIETIAID